MNHQCENSNLLIPGYLDGELSEEQATPLRRHLLECMACRDIAQDDQAMKRWFVAEEPLIAPPGFAARIARRAFAGDTGLLMPAVPGEDVLVAQKDEGQFQFVLRMTSIAAAVLFCFSLAIRTQSLPGSADLSATDNYSEVLDNLERLNTEEAAVLQQELLQQQDKLKRSKADESALDSEVEADSK
ncbi:MAG: anti-sigma factor RsiW [Planctomycetota bacterium]|jgi:anti-sigma factor RsiW